MKSNSVLKLVDGEPMMVRIGKSMKSPVINIAVFNESIGFLYTKDRIILQVFVEKQQHGYALKSGESYFSSRPLDTNQDKSTFLDNRKSVKAWEIFDLDNTKDSINEVMIQKLLYFNSKCAQDILNVFWYRNSKFLNFGDELNPYIISFLSKKQVNRVRTIDSELVGIGSILDWFPTRETPYKVWGSGTLSPSNILSDDMYQVSLLRGPLTASLFNSFGHYNFGDPGLLSSDIWIDNNEKKYDWGLIAHINQFHEPWVKSLLENTPNSIFIDVTHENMDELMKQISSCKRIASASLHGLVVADSFNIPNMWLWGGNIHRGGQWKFFDYFAGINRKNVDNVNPATLSSLNTLNSKLDKSDFKYFDRIESIKSRIKSSFPL